MAEKVVRFDGPKDLIELSYQRKVVDMILDHLGIEVVKMKDGIYTVRDVKKGKKK